MWYSTHPFTLRTTLERDTFPTSVRGEVLILVKFGSGLSHQKLAQVGELPVVHITAILSFSQIDSTLMKGMGMVIVVVCFCRENFISNFSSCIYSSFIDFQISLSFIFYMYIIMFSAVHTISCIF